MKDYKKGTSEVFSHVLGLIKDRIRQKCRFFGKKKETAQKSETISFWINFPNLILYRYKPRDPRTLSPERTKTPQTITNITQNYYQTKLQAGDLLTVLEKLSFNQWSHLQNTLTTKYHSYPSVTPSVYHPTIRARYESPHEPHTTHSLIKETVLTHRESTETKQRQEIETLRQEILIWKTNIQPEALREKSTTSPTTLSQREDEQQKNQETILYQLSPAHLRQIYAYQERCMLETMDFERLRRGM